MPIRTQHGAHHTPRRQQPPAMHETPTYTSDDDDELMTQQVEYAMNDQRHSLEVHELGLDEDELLDDPEADEIDEGEVKEELSPLEAQLRSNIPPIPPPGLKEISSLASWTVSTSKPGCGVQALRHPTTTQFWQSDGPQPHTLTIHFFKMVSICALRVHLDYSLDESYTPSKIEFYAGTHAGDLIMWSELKVNEPRGWLVIDFEGVGDVPDGVDEFLEGVTHSEDEPRPDFDVDSLPVLRCMLLQLKICENHQNGKDTHLRGLQILAKDELAKTGVGAVRSTLGASTDNRDSFAMPVRPKTKSKQREAEWEMLDGLGDEVGLR